MLVMRFIQVQALVSWKGGKIQKMDCRGDRDAAADCNSPDTGTEQRLAAVSGLGLGFDLVDLLSDLEA